MSKEYECNDCGAVFSVHTIEDSDESESPQFCPFCGNDDLEGDAGEFDDDEDELFDDDEED